MLSWNTGADPQQRSSGMTSQMAVGPWFPHSFASLIHFKICSLQHLLLLLNQRHWKIHCYSRLFYNTRWFGVWIQRKTKREKLMQGSGCIKITYEKWETVCIWNSRSKSNKYTNEGRRSLIETQGSTNCTGDEQCFAPIHCSLWQAQQGSHIPQSIPAWQHDSVPATSLWACSPALVGLGTALRFHGFLWWVIHVCGAAGDTLWAFSKHTLRVGDVEWK